MALNYRKKVSKLNNRQTKKTVRTKKKHPTQKSVRTVSTMELLPQKMMNYLSVEMFKKNLVSLQSSFFFLFIYIPVLSRTCMQEPKGALPIV